MPIPRRRSYGDTMRLLSKFRIALGWRRRCDAFIRSFYHFSPILHNASRVRSCVALH